MPGQKRSVAPAVVAIVAGVAGIAILVVAAIRLVGVVTEWRDTPAATAATATTAPSATTTSIVATETTAPVTFDPGATTLLFDDSATLSLSVPAEWTDVSGSPWVLDEGEVGPGIAAAIDIDDWYSTWGTPGVFVGVSTTGFEPQSGDFSSVCSPGATSVVGAGDLAGSVTTWFDCGAEGGDFHVLVANSADSSYAVLMQLVTIDGTGDATLADLLATLRYQP